MISRRQFNIGAGLVAGAGALSPWTLRAQEPAGVAWMYVGPASDFGWSYQHDEGRKAVEAAYGDKVKTSFVENVPEGADAERVITQLAAAGNKLVFTTSFGFMNPTLKVAERFPDVKFEHCTGYQRRDNVATYAARFYEGRTVCGHIAGRMTKSNIIGYLGSFPIPEVVAGINAFTLALRKVNPAAEVRVVWVNSWYDPGSEAAAAKALIDQGADIISQHTDSPAAMQVAEERGVYAFGQASDMTQFGPRAHLTAIVDDWAPYYVDRVGKLLDGTWASGDTWGGFAQGMVAMSPWGQSVPADVAAEADTAVAQIKSGELHPFAGPIKDQAGAEVLAAGKTHTDEEILGMAYFVEGVQGTIPN